MHGNLLNILIKSMLFNWFCGQIFEKWRKIKRLKSKMHKTKSRSEMAQKFVRMSEGNQQNVRRKQTKMKNENCQNKNRKEMNEKNNGKITIRK